MLGIRSGNVVLVLSQPARIVSRSEVILNNRPYQAQYRMNARHWEAHTRRQPTLAEMLIIS